MYFHLRLLSISKRTNLDVEGVENWAPRRKAFTRSIRDILHRNLFTYLTFFWNSLFSVGILNLTESTGRLGESITGKCTSFIMLVKVWNVCTEDDAQDNHHFIIRWVCDVFDSWNNFLFFNLFLLTEWFRYFFDILKTKNQSNKIFYHLYYAEQQKIRIYCYFIPVQTVLMKLFNRFVFLMIASCWNLIIIDILVSNLN